MICHNKGLIVLILIITYATFLRAYDFDSVWLFNHHGFNGAFYSIIARNYVRYGWSNLKFAQILDAGPLDPDSSPYYNHQPLLPILVSISFKLFGIHEWSATLVPIGFSVASIIVLYLLVRKIWNERVALFSCFFMTLMPMASYYGPNLSSEGNIMLFSVLLTIYFYTLYLKTPRARYLYLMILSFLFGALTDWPAFYAVPLLSLHYLLFSSNTKKHKSFFIFPIFGCFLFLLFLYYIHTITGSFYSFFYLLFHRASSYASDSDLTQTFTMIQWFNKISLNMREHYTLPILILSSIWFVIFITKLIKKQNFAHDLVVIILLLFGLIHIFLGRQGAWVHEYWSALLIPSLAISAALPLDKFYNFIFTPGRKYVLYLRSGFYLLLLIFLFYCTTKLYSLYQSDKYNPYIKYWYNFGTTINKISEFNEAILTAEETRWPMVQFYSDRNLQGVITSLSLFYQIYNTNNFQKYRYFFLPQVHEMKYGALYGFLVQAFNSKIKDGFFIFDLKSKKLDDIETNNYLLKFSRYEYNFWDNLKRSEILAEGGNFVSRDLIFSINQDARKVIYQHPNSKITFKNIFIPDNTLLKFGIGINPSAWDENGDGVLFEVIVNYSGREHVLFSKYINPKSNLADRRWHDEMIDLSTFSNKEIAITLVTKGGPKNDMDYDWAGWSNLGFIFKKVEAAEIRE